MPHYQPIGGTVSDAAAQYRALADQHRLYAQGYVDAAAKREREKGRADRLVKSWRAQARAEYAIAQRADNEAMRLEQR